MTAPSRAFLTAHWHHLVMVNIEICPNALRPYLPIGTELDFHQGRTFLSLIGFQFSKMRVRGISIPFHQHFEQINLRFYARRKEQNGWRRGVVFLSELTNKRSLLWAANHFYGEQYSHTKTTSFVLGPDQNENQTVHYSWESNRKRNFIQVKARGPLVLPTEGTEADFIVNRFSGFTARKQKPSTEFLIKHPPWRLWTVQSFLCSIHDLPAIPVSIGKALSQTPSSVLMVDGSPVTLYESWPIHS